MDSLKITSVSPGDGVDPRNNGANIYNESNLFHEALHGLTAEYDDYMYAIFHIGPPAINNSIHIKDTVLSACPISRR